jgi:hypothetical protein
MFLKQNNTVESVIGSFNKLVLDLERVEKTQLAEVERQEQTLIYAQAAKVAATNELTKARSIRNNILNLIKG